MTSELTVMMIWDLGEFPGHEQLMEKVGVGGRGQEDLIPAVLV